MVCFVCLFFLSSLLNNPIGAFSSQGAPRCFFFVTELGWDMMSIYMNKAYLEVANKRTVGTDQGLLIAPPLCECQSGPGTHP